MLNIQKKRRQHHVWQKYLEPWSKDGAIYFLANGQIKKTGTRVIAVEKDFYALEKLNQQDMALVKRLVVDTQNRSSQRAHDKFLSRLFSPLWFEGNNAVVDKLIDVYRTNVLEDHHAAIEASFIPLLEKALSGDVGFYADDKGCAIFLNFICSQYMRTKGLKEKIISQSHVVTGLDLSRIWVIWSLMFATNMGSSIYVERKRRRLFLLHNNTKIPFITGDQPVINFDATAPTAPEKVSFYYPISPGLALFLSEVDETPPFSSDLSVERVKDFNIKIIEHSHSQVFGHSEAALQLAAEFQF